MDCPIEAGKLRLFLKHQPADNRGHSPVAFVLFVTYLQGHHGLRLVCLFSVSLSLSLALFFLSAGLRGRLATLRHLARPTTHLFMKWSALGHSRLWYKTTEWDPFFRVVTPSLNTKQSHNPCLVPAPRWLSTMVPTRCLHGLFPQAVEKQACSSIAKQENNNEDSLSLSLFPSLRPVSSCILPHSLSLCLVCLSVACSVASER